MASTSAVVEKARALLEERRSELQDELRQVDRAIKDLGGSSRSMAKRGPGRPRSARNGTAPKRRRRRRGGTRAEQALKHLQESPGMTAPEISSKLGIKPNYVYRVMAELETDGKVKKKGKTYHPVG
jgi:DNA-binding IclR family transcriptional regulator